MKTKRAFIIDAVIRYISEGGQTPYVVVDAGHPDVIVPDEYVQNGFITLNISPRSVHNYELGDDGLRFSARFNRVSRFISVPLSAICSIFPKEDIRDSIVFVKIEDTHFSGTFTDEFEQPAVQEIAPPVVRTKPTLSIVKVEKPHE